MTIIPTHDGIELRTKVKLAILDFDIENRPLSYWIKDRPTADVTAIAWSWVGVDHVHCELQTLEPGSREDMLRGFRRVYDVADMVTGHYIRKHDLPILNGAMVEIGLPPLGDKLASDTKLDLINWYDIPQSQEHLGTMLGLVEQKYHMTQARWREANRLTPEGLEETRKRVMDDVRQHKELRARMIELGLLKPPVLWEP